MSSEESEVDAGEDEVDEVAAGGGRRKRRSVRRVKKLNNESPALTKIKHKLDKKFLETIASSDCRQQLAKVTRPGLYTSTRSVPTNPSWCYQESN